MINFKSKLLLLMLSLIASANSFALITGYSYSSVGPWFTTPQLACQAWFDKMPESSKAYYGNGVKTMAAPYNACRTLVNDNYTAIVSKENAVEEPPVNCTDKKPFVRKFLMEDGGKFPKAADGCKVIAGDVLVCRKEKINGVLTSMCMIEVTRTGDPDKTADVKEAKAQSTPEDKVAPVIPVPPTAVDSVNSPCPKGTVQGGIDPDGIPRCIGTGSTPPSSKTTQPVITKAPVTVTNADGSKTTTTTTVTSNSDGSKTTVNDVVTVAADGTKTTTANSDTSKNESGGDGKKDKDETDFCAKNPTLTICRESTVSGKCGETSCTGDAIQCSQLRIAATMQCVAEKEAKELADTGHAKLGAQLLAGSDPAAATLPSVKTAKVVNVESLDSSGWMGGGAFFADKRIPVPGVGEVVIPFSKAENAFLVLRAVSMVFGALVSAKILRQSVIGA